MGRDPDGFMAWHRTAKGATSARLAPVQPCMRSGQPIFVPALAASCSGQGGHARTHTHGLYRIKPARPWPDGQIRRSKDLPGVRPGLASPCSRSNWLGVDPPSDLLSGIALIRPIVSCLTFVLFPFSARLTASSPRLATLPSHFEMATVSLHGRAAGHSDASSVNRSVQYVLMASSGPLARTWVPIAGPKALEPSRRGLDTERAKATGRPPVTLRYAFCHLGTEGARGSPARHSLSYACARLETNTNLIRRDPSISSSSKEARLQLAYPRLEVEVEVEVEVRARAGNFPGDGWSSCARYAPRASDAARLKGTRDRGRDRRSNVYPQGTVRQLGRQGSEVQLMKPRYGGSVLAVRVHAICLRASSLSALGEERRREAGQARVARKN
ncbi:uncharacterized protein PSFLO_07122 [Pseudozyma flocculosa]|uniref:Uncharacterized protein n=1 Tax=Pseudozyma flocculosa TaxID=84751 RepID=A0A5C3FBJ5_9BASI|nr:uncharacterized protein PSFLO_07122 [Pseudozyma flocculosa]